MRRFFSRVAVSFGLKEEDKPPPEPTAPPSKLRVAFALVASSLVVGFLSELAYVIFDGDQLEASAVAAKATIFCGLMVVIRIAQHVASRSFPTRADGDPPART